MSWGWTRAGRQLAVDDFGDQVRWNRPKILVRRAALGGKGHDPLKVVGIPVAAQVRGRTARDPGAATRPNKLAWYAFNKPCVLGFAREQCDGR